MVVRIRVVAGPDMGRSFAVPQGKPVLVGRGKEADVQLNDPSVSRAHCQISPVDGGFLVHDLGSRSGVLVNGERITDHPLKDSDIVQIGTTQFQVEMKNVPELETVLPGAVAAPARPLPPPLVPAAGPAPPPLHTQARPPVAMTQAQPKATAFTQPLPALGDKGDKPPLLPAERMDELTGYTMSSYRLGKVLAKGQSGLLFEGTDLKSGRTVALKVLWPDFSRDDDEVKRFVRAMKTMLPVQHPHLVALFGAGKAAGYCWVAMEYVDAESLAEAMSKAAGALPWKDCVRVGIHVSRALVYAHHQRIVHRNITPRNILVGRGGTVKLGDLMLSKALEGSLAAHITSKGQLLGDLNYLAPERTSGQIGEVDERSDLYSLGATLYAAVAGKPPHQGKSMIETILKIRQERPAPLRTLQPAIPPELDGVVMKLLAKAPEDRQQKAAEVLAALQQLAKAHAVPV